ncbi:hypothetical protein HanRHA438_Chr16g0740581 [Helianthus annuus]|nr:hypothetical protein HanRHA438_Chr16g0740581 [Helianthus annuus]
MRFKAISKVFGCKYELKTLGLGCKYEDISSGSHCISYSSLEIYVFVLLRKFSNFVLL